MAGCGDWDADGFRDIVVGSPLSETSVDNGDLDQDGWVDLVVGADAFDAPSGSDAGRARAYDIVVHQPNLGFGGPGTGTLDVIKDDLLPLGFALSNAVRIDFLP